MNQHISHWEFRFFSIIKYPGSNQVCRILVIRSASVPSVIKKQTKSIGLNSFYLSRVFLFSHVLLYSTSSSSASSSHWMNFWSCWRNKNVKLSEILHDKISVTAVDGPADHCADTNSAFQLLRIQIKNTSMLLDSGLYPLSMFYFSQAANILLSMFMLLIFPRAQHSRSECTHPLVLAKLPALIGCGSLGEPA